MIGRKTHLSATIAACIFALSVSEVRGQERLDPDTLPVIRTTGESVMTSEPDLAEIQIGVETEGSTARVTAENNAKRVETVIKNLRELLGEDADIRTTGYSIHPVYAVPRDGRRTITHYSAANIVRVRTADLKRVGEVIDRANAAGANTIHGLRFTLKDDTSVRRMALEAAARQAREKAEALASALGVGIRRILRVEESGSEEIEFARRGVSFEMAASAPTPIEPGDVEIRMAVTLTVEVSQ